MYCVASVCEFFVYMLFLLWCYLLGRDSSLFFCGLRVFVGFGFSLLFGRGS